MSLLRFYFLLLTTATVCWAATLAWPRLNATDEPGLPAASVLAAQVTVVPQRPAAPGYEREHFGAGWADLEHCTAREDTILRQTSGPARLPGPGSPCTVDIGTFYDPYAHATAPIATQTIEVDHVFPLAAAWDLGAHSWDDATRQRFANDPRNLIATAKELNRDKSDQLPSQWLPPSPRTQCWYARRVLAVAVDYGLAVPRADVATTRRTCLLSAR